MTKHKFAELLGSIDPALIARAETPEPTRKKAGIMIAIIAAALALLACTALVIIPFIPKNLDIAYEPSEGSPGNVWVYYVGENGKQQRELVKQPGGAQNVFASWQHLNEVDEQVQLLDYQITTEPMAGTTVVPDTLWEFVMQQMGKRDEQTIVTATLSAGITSYENQDALIESLIQTIAKYAGVSPEQVRILIDGETIGITVPLQFWHNLQGGGDVIIGTGDTLEITVGMTNVSDGIIHYTGSSSAFVPDATLRMGNIVIEHEIRPFTEDEAHLTLAPGESREVTYRFIIPTDAPTGVYDLTVTYKGDSFTFTQAVQVVVTTVLDILPTIPNYTFIGLTFPESSGTLPQNIQTKILSAIQNSVCVGQAECDAGDIVFACNESETNSHVNYCGSHFHIYGYAWAPTGDDADFMDALVYALNAYKGDNGYDTLLYYNGDFYGHSDAVDQAYQDKPINGDGLSYKANEDYVVAAKVLYTPDFLYDKTFYVQNGYLWLDDGSYFEKVVNPSDSSSVAWHTECALCGNLDGENRWFYARVLSSNSVMPLGNHCFEAVSASDIGICLDLSAYGVETGDIVRIEYNGYIMESYPPQIRPDAVKEVVQNNTQTDTSFDSDTLFDYEMQYKPTYEDYLQIREGMTVEEVVEILGKPHYRDSAVGSKYFCWETADGASCAIKVVSPHATEGWSDWADILQPHYGGATVVHCSYYGTVPDQGGK